jgi:hypothetical protein
MHQQKLGNATTENPVNILLAILFFCLGIDREKYKEASE